MLLLLSRRPKRLASFLTIGLSAALLSGCSSMESWVDDATGNQALEYKQARSAPTLEVPPDLTTSSIDDRMVVPDLGPTASGSASLSDYTRERIDGPSYATLNKNRGQVLATPDKITVKRDGDRRWLVVQGGVDETWTLVHDFWVSNGWLMKVDDPRIGIMETDWAENRAGLPGSILRDFLGGAFGSLYDAGTRDKFRVRLEQGLEANTTEVYMTHYGAEEQFDGSGDLTRWIMRPRDPELEIEMLRRLAVHLGVEEKRSSTLLASGRADGKPNASMVRGPDGSAAVRLDEGFNRAWRKVGLVLDRTGFAVEDRDRKQGLYYVRYIDPLREEKDKGWLNSLAFWSEDKPPETRYQINVRTRKGVSLISVLNDQGVPEKSRTGVRILELLHEKLR